MRVERLTGLLLDGQSRSYVSVAAGLQVSLKQQPLHFAAFGLLLSLNLVKRELQDDAGRQPGLQQGEFEGGRGDDRC